MKNISISKKSHPAVFLACKNFGQIIQWAEREGSKDGLYIAKVQLNGRVVDEDEESLLDRLSTKEVKLLEIQYMQVAELVVETIMSTIQLLQNLQVVSTEQGLYIQKHNKVVPNTMKEIFSKSRMLITTLEEVFAAHSNDKMLLRHFSLWREAEKELSTILQCLLQGFEIQDYPIVGELLEGAFPEALGLWEDVLSKELRENKRLSPIFELKKSIDQRDNTLDGKSGNQG